MTGELAGADDPEQLRPTVATRRHQLEVPPQNKRDPSRRVALANQDVVSLHLEPHSGSEQVRNRALGQARKEPPQPTGRRQRGRRRPTRGCSGSAHLDAPAERTTVVPPACSVRGQASPPASPDLPTRRPVPGRAERGVMMLGQML